MTIYKATYSGVGVFEMPCKGVAVMRRRDNSWLNATQILKVAGFDKPQRTRVLEREVQRGQHEKIQGGYGKFQGTWVPLDRGIELSKQYGVNHLLSPLTSYQPSTNDSPPLAPKHITAPSSRSKNNRVIKPPISTGSVVPPSLNGRRTNNSRSNFDVDHLSLGGSKQKGVDIPVQIDDHSSALSRSVSPVDEEDHSLSQAGGDPSLAIPHVPAPDLPIPATSGKRKHEAEELVQQHPDEELPTTSKYAKAILDYFVSESSQVPSFLIEAPEDFDANVIIDDDGHTALHWACAMGRTQIVKLLLDCGADIFRSNNVGQTALMRAVMFTNNYDLKTFSDLFEGFRHSVINIDRNDRTVFHYVIDIALQKGKINAARYYLETILNRLSDYPRELADILNFQDEDGETALTLAVRSRSKRLVRILLDHGSNSKIANREGKSAEDYMAADEKFRGLEGASYSTIEPGSEDNQGTFNGIGIGPFTAAGSLDEIQPSSYQNPTTCPIISQTSTKLITQIKPQITNMITDLSQTFTSELNEKNEELNEATNLLCNIKAELLSGEKKLTNYNVSVTEILEKKKELVEMEKVLNDKINCRFRFGWEKYVRDEQERYENFNLTRNSLIQNLSSTNPTTEKQRIELNLKQYESENQDILDLLKSPTPDISNETEKLRTEIQTLSSQRTQLFKDFIDLSSENNFLPDTAEHTATLNDYRKLISLGCGGIGLDEVDEVIDSLSEGIEFPSSSGIQDVVSGGGLNGERRVSGGGRTTPFY